MSDEIDFRVMLFPVQSWSLRVQREPEWAIRQIGGLLTRALEAELTLGLLVDALEKGAVPPELLARARKVSRDD